MTNKREPVVRLGRRSFIKQGALVLTVGAASRTALAATESAGLKVGLVTDLHYADKAPGGTRMYRETPDKLAEAAERFQREKPDFIVELGDLIDAADSVSAELDYLKRINRDFAHACPQRHYVLGNHCVYTLTKQEFLDEVERDESYYSFDCGDFHFVVLDACFCGNGEPYGRKNFHWTDANVPASELDWLQDDLKQTGKPTIVFAHQRLDVSNSHGVKNALQVRKTLEESGRVLAVFQGHSHQNDYREIGGIHYTTLVAMVEGSGAENNAYSTMELRPGEIRITGFRKQQSYEWKG